MVDFGKKLNEKEFHLTTPLKASLLVQRISHLSLALKDLGLRPACIMFHFGDTRKNNNGKMQLSDAKLALFVVMVKSPKEATGWRTLTPG